MHDTLSAAVENATTVGMWPHSAVIAPNNFIYKSLSNWAFNIAVGCSHGCSFCYVPSAATIKQGAKLEQLGVMDPDLEWGKYVFLREWNEERFLGSLRTANETPLGALAKDGNRAVMYCTTTDPYQVFHHPDASYRRELGASARKLVRRSLELIRDKSDLNVRILTRSPLARVDFDIFKSFGPRLLFGMSVPTLDSRLARLYEPHAPAPEKRIETLQAARDAGLHVYVAVAPTFPESNSDDLRATLRAAAELNPITVFHEPINIRAENVVRIAARAHELSVAPRTDVFETREAWQDYAIESFRCVQKLAKEVGLTNKQLHLWPDRALGSAACLARARNPSGYQKWLRGCWSKISQWPK
jgi:DNA repair photolyase